MRIFLVVRPNRWCSIDRMKNILIGGAILCTAVILGLLIFTQQDAAPADEPTSEKIVYVAQGKFAEKDNLGKWRFIAGAEQGDPLSFDDYEAALTSEYIEKGAGLAFSRGLVQYEGQEVIQNLITVTNTDFPEVFGFPVSEGRFITNEETENSVVVGQALKDELINEHGLETVIGAQLDVRGTAFTIVGVLDTISTGNTAADGDWNKLLMVPRHQSDPILEEAPLVKEIRFIARGTKDLTKAADDVRQKIQESRGKEDFTVLTVTDARQLGLTQ